MPLVGAACCVAECPGETIVAQYVVILVAPPAAFSSEP
jgi:hypothetical protein